MSAVKSGRGALGAGAQHRWQANPEPLASTLASRDESMKGISPLTDLRPPTAGTPDAS